MPDPTPPKPRPDDEPDVYELADEPDDTPPPPPAPEASPPTTKPTASTEEADTIPLSEPDDGPEVRDPRAAGTASRPERRPAAIDPTPDADDAPAEPKEVSPARARAVREEQRIRAAAELAEAEAKRKKVILTLVAAFVGVGVVGYVVLRLFL
ncbi:MAG: hypothetical protein AAF710_01570 [Planctomycetota bacterium]